MQKALFIFVALIGFSLSTGAFAQQGGSAPTGGGEARKGDAKGAVPVMKAQPNSGMDRVRPGYDPKLENKRIETHEKEVQESSILLAIMIIMGMAVGFGVLALAFVGAKVVGGVVRNPGSRSAVMPLLLLSMALIESVVIYALVISILLYAKL